MDHRTARRPVELPAVHPGKGWYVIAALVFFLAISGATTVLVRGIFSPFTGGTRFLVPGSVTIMVDTPGSYTLWNEVNANFDGRVYRGDPELPEMFEIRITELAHGKHIPLSSSAGGRETVGATERYAIGTMRLEDRGEYLIEVSGGFRERIFLIRRSVWGDLAAAAVTFLLLGLVAFVGAPVLTVAVFLRRRASYERMRTQEQPAGATPAQDTAGTRPFSADRGEPWATFCHLGSLSGLLFPFGHLFVPLILWIAKKDEFPLVEIHGRESLNFQLSMTLYYLLSAVLMIALVGFLLLPALLVFNLIVVIIASVKANRGESYRYPLTIRFIRERSPQPPIL